MNICRGVSVVRRDRIHSKAFLKKGKEKGKEKRKEKGKEKKKGKGN